MQIAKGRVSCHPRQKTMLDQQRLQVVRSFGDPCRRKADVLIEDRRSFRPQLADDPEQTFAYPPVNLDRLGVTCEIHRME